jgi:hypothetical protein
VSETQEKRSEGKRDDGYETCPVHGDTLMHAEDVPGWEPGGWDDPLLEHLVCTVCDYEVRA